jgi:cell division ATPase FtsA
MSASSNGEELVLVFDIGSSSVGGSLFYIGKNGIPRILTAVRELIPIEEILDIDRLLSLTLKSLKKVAGKICMQGLGTPKRVFCVLSSPWYASETRTIKYSKNTPFEFTSKLADELIQKEIVLFEQAYKTKNSEMEGKIRPIELKNMRTVLNGYPTNNPFGQKAKDLEMNIFISMSGENILTQIEGAIKQHFHIPIIKFSSFVVASFTISRDMFVNQENFLLINIGGEVTDISMVKKDVLKEAISYPAGSNFLVRGVSQEMSMTTDEAKSLIATFKEGHIDDASYRKIEPVISKLKNQWLRKFQESLSNITSDISIPSTIFITVDPSLGDFFSDIIKTEEFSQYTLTESKFRVFFLSTQALHGIAIFDSNATRDPFLIIESIYINHFLK